MLNRFLAICVAIGLFVLYYIFANLVFKINDTQSIGFIICWLLFEILK